MKTKRDIQKITINMVGDDSPVQSNDDPSQLYVPSNAPLRWY